MTDETATSTDDSVGTRVAARFDDLRDAASDALATDESPASRELDRVRRRLDDVEGSISSAMSELGQQQRELTHEVHAASQRTTLPRKLFWMALGAFTGAAVAWINDPDRGSARRAQLSDQLGSQTRAVTSQARAQAQQVANRAKGSAIEATRAVLPDDVPDDPSVLVQRIKSQVLGHHDDADDVVVTVGSNGHVALNGTVQRMASLDDLTGAVGAVNGVTHVQSNLLVAGDQST